MTIRILEQVVGTANKVRILRVMVTLTRPVSGREAGRLAGVSSKAIVALDELAALGLVTKREGTGQFLYSFNRKHVLAKSVAAVYAAEERRTRDLFSAIQETLSAVTGVTAASVFGSTARGEAKARSDLDLLVVVEDATDESVAFDALIESSKTYRERFGVRLSPVVITKARWVQQIEAQDTFAQAVLREGVTVFGSLDAEGGRVEKGKKKAG